MSDELKKFLEELHNKELKEPTDRFFAKTPMTAYPNGDTLVPIEARKQFPIYDMDHYVGIHGIDYFKEMVVEDMMGDVLKMLDEMGLIDLEARIAGMDKIEFKLTLKVLKDGTKPIESRGFNPHKLRDWPL